eukprot:scaffold27149_cov67-Phaeocystis_antarctica.AAC.1
MHKVVPVLMISKKRWPTRSAGPVVLNHSLLPRMAAAYCVWLTPLNATPWCTDPEPPHHTRTRCLSRGKPRSQIRPRLRKAGTASAVEDVWLHGKRDAREGHARLPRIRGMVVVRAQRGTDAMRSQPGHLDAQLDVLFVEHHHQRRPTAAAERAGVSLPAWQPSDGARWILVEHPAKRCDDHVKLPRLVIDLAKGHRLASGLLPLARIAWSHRRPSRLDAVAKRLEVRPQHVVVVHVGVVRLVEPSDTQGACMGSVVGGELHLRGSAAPRPSCALTIRALLARVDRAHDIAS